MALRFHHRKLLDDSPPADLAVICERPCDILWNPNGNCPFSCLDFCPAVCTSPILPFPPPPVSAVTDTDGPRQLSVLLIACLAVLATAFFLFACYSTYKLYTVWRSKSLRRRPSRREDGDEIMAVVDHPIWHIRTIGLQPSVINAIAIVQYKRADGLVEGKDCAVCLNEFEEDETLRLLPNCNHAFHIPCIDTWLESHTNCPMCRAGIAIGVAGPLPSQEPVANDSGQVEEARSETVSEDARSQSGVEMNEDVKGGNEKVETVGLDDGVQHVRRSVSMDSLSASMLSAAIANGRNRVERLLTGSSSIKRSASCSAQVYLSRHSSRNRN